MSHSSSAGGNLLKADMRAREPEIVTVEPAELPGPSMRAGEADDAPSISNAIDLVKDVPLTLEVRLGQGSITVQELLDLRDGSVVQLQRRVDDPVDVLFNDKVIARGQLVASGNRFGVRITEINSVA